MFMKFSVDKFNWKKKFFGKIESILGGKKKLTGLMRPPEGYGTIDYMNRNKIPWLKVRNEKTVSNESVDELLARARDNAVIYINNYMNYIEKDIPLKRRDFSVNYEGVRIN